MKRRLLFLTACILSTPSAFAQHAFEKGAMILQPGIGYGLDGTTGALEIPPVSLGLEFGASEEWSIGGYAGYAASRDFFQYSYFIFGGRLSYHIETESERLDPYAGVMLGYNAVTVSVEGFGQPISASASAVLYGGQLGVRYYLSPAVGLFAEAGYGIGYLTAGLSFKLGGSRPATASRKADNDIWQKLDAEVSRAEAEELEAELEKSLRARILEKKQNIFIIDVGENAGLQTGMDLKVSPLFNGKAAGKYALPAKVAQARQRHAIIKIYDTQLAALLAIGDDLAVQLMPLAVEKY